MPDPSYSRISITLPPEVLATADRLARALDRPRSWVFAEAMRRFGQIEDLPPDEAPGLPPADALARLHADLSLSPEERVRVAEAQARADSETPQRPADQILCFTRFEDYLRWSERSRGPV